MTIVLSGPHRTYTRSPRLQTQVLPCVLERLLFARIQINVPVHLFHGMEDKFAPFAYAEYLDEKLPHSQLHAYAGEGHFHVMDLFEEVFEKVSNSSLC